MGFDSESGMMSKLLGKPGNHGGGYGIFSNDRNILIVGLTLDDRTSYSIACEPMGTLLDGDWQLSAI